MSIFNTGKSLLRKTKPIPIFLTINDEFVPYAACTIASLIRHANPKRYYRIIILHDGLSFKNYFHLRNLVTRNCEIQFRKMSHSVYLRTIIHHCSSRTGSGDFFSSAVYYYRSFIAPLFPQYNKAVYLDSDTILVDDIAELYDTNLEDNMIGACVDPKVEAVPEFREYVDKAVGVPYQEYVNSGVLLLDLKKLRKIHYVSQLIRMINEFDADLVAPDQDYLNVICRGQILHLDQKWNMQPVKGNLPDDTKLIHFNLFKKPWHYDDVDCEDLFWEAAKHSGYYEELMERKNNYSVTDMRLNEAKIEALIKKAAKLAKSKAPVIHKIDIES